MKHSFWPELWFWMGFIAMAWALFSAGRDQHFVFIMGMLAIIRSDTLASRDELQRWRRM